MWASHISTKTTIDDAIDRVLGGNYISGEKLSILKKSGQIIVEQTLLWVSQMV